MWILVHIFFNYFPLLRKIIANFIAKNQNKTSFVDSKNLENVGKSNFIEPFKS